MSVVTSKSVPLDVYLRLGRVSNLPTAWTNVLAGTVLGAGAGTPIGRTTWLVLFAVTACYIAGMFLNDVFDRELDARERPTRPIPAGLIDASSVAWIGCTMLTGGVAILFMFGSAAALSGCALAATIVLYDAWHKGNPASPLLMGICRALVYVISAFAAAGAASFDGSRLCLAALALLAHIAGLTYAAKQEGLDRLGSAWPLAILALPVVLLVLAAFHYQAWLATLVPVLGLALADAVEVRRLIRRAMPGDVPQAVARLIAATSLLDGAVVTLAGAGLPLLLTCLVAYGATRVLHRSIAGT